MATKAKKRRPRPKRLRQQRLPGLEPDSHKDIDAAADHYYETMMERVGMSKEEDEAKTALIEKMKEHGCDRYETPDGLVVTVLNKSNLKCKKKKDEEPSENGDGEENGEE